MSLVGALEFRQIQAAASRLAGRVNRTPLLRSALLSEHLGAEIYLKLENLQLTGSFKVRGALNKILAEPSCGGGVVAASAGNHAQGVALAAARAGASAQIVMPEWASISKQEATRALGADVVLHGSSVEEAIDRAKELAGASRVFVHPFDDYAVMAGQGTIGLEIAEDLPEVQRVVVPIGGGGLISGIASALATAAPHCRVNGVQAAAAPSARESCARGEPVTLPAKPTVADGIAIKSPGRLTLPIIKELVSEVVLAEEEDLVAAVLWLTEREKVLAEGAGAAPVAALLGGALSLSPGEKVVLVISGGNLDSPLLGRMVNQGLMLRGRLHRLTVRLPDQPGALAGLLNLVASLKANVLHISHDRNVRDLTLDQTRVKLELETRGPAHIQEITAALRDAGYEE